LDKGRPFKDKYRSITFESSTSNILVFIYHPPACLRLMSKEDVAGPNIPLGLEKIIPLSDLNRVISKPARAAVPPGMMKVPARDWCYYYEKAELANQIGDWQETVRLAEMAEDRRLTPYVAYEWMPFFEAYSHVGDWENAQKLAEHILGDENNKPELCSVWEKVKKEEGDTIKTQPSWVNLISQQCH
jgi:hypothetical protein